MNYGGRHPFHNPNNTLKRQIKLIHLYLRIDHNPICKESFIKRIDSLVNHTSSVLYSARPPPIHLPSPSIHPPSFLSHKSKTLQSQPWEGRAVPKAIHATEPILFSDASARAFYLHARWVSDVLKKQRRFCRTGRDW